jgi:tetratricopeptide (TPR) repeat protein
MKRLIASTIVFLIAFPVAGEEISAEAMRLRNAGVADLENEQPADAEETFALLAKEMPGDLLPWANLAIARLRQQKFPAAEEAIAKALKIAPSDPELLSIQAEILQWSGNPEQSLALLRTAGRAATDRVSIQYALWSQASSLTGAEAEAAKAEALDRLADLRPDNLLVLLQKGQAAIASGDRTEATGAFLRVQEVVWQAPDAAETLLGQIFEALESDEIAQARVPALRLENVLKITPMYKEGLRELSPAIQGVPMTRFRDEPDPTSFGDPIDVRFESQSISTTATSGRGLVSADFDSDGVSDWVRLVDTSPPSLEVRLSTGTGPRSLEVPRPGLDRLITVDLDNDGQLDLLAYGAKAIEVFRATGDGDFEVATAVFGLESIGATAVAPIDFDIEGDLDLALMGGLSGSGDILRNSLEGPLVSVGSRSLPKLEIETVHDLIATDLDRDGDVDLVVAHDGGLTWLDNLRQGSFVDRTAQSGLASSSRVVAVASADFDSDGMPDLVTSADGISFLHNVGGRFEPWSFGESLRTSARFDSVLPFDADNDGRLDLAVSGPDGLAVLAQRQAGELTFLALGKAPKSVSALAAGDLDGDCDLDLLAASEAGLFQLENQGGNKNKCLSVRLVGLNKGNSKNNMFGLGATIEVRAGQAYQFREVVGDTTHFGVGNIAVPDLMRVVWSNGVPQNRLQPESNQRVVEEQVVKGSCPFLYTWDGNKIRFVTDLLWGAPAGLPIAPGKWASADPAELVKVEGARPDQSSYDLRITEELWEAAFFDLTRLWVVDHPNDVEVSSSLRIVPGRIIADRVHGTRQLQPVSAWTGSGEEISTRLAARDEIYADAWTPSPYQGVAANTWTLELDLGEAPAKPIRLILDGWIFPSDASLNLAVAQRHDLSTAPPQLEALVDGHWRTIVDEMGFPAGKTKSMVVDTPSLAEGVRRLRIVATQWLSFDRIVWSDEISDGEPVVVERLLPKFAELQFRGFSRQFRSAPNGPHYFDYSRTTTESPWLPFPGRYTRYGDVRELLSESDDRSVVIGPGDEIRLLFDASTLAPPPDGWSRTLFLESHGWDKDADRNTWQAQQVAPLPFRSMSGYPFADEDSPPRNKIYEEYLRVWLTREIAPVPGILPGLSP